MSAYAPAKPAQQPMDSNAALIARYRACRARTEALTATLSPEDQQLQSMPDCSPAKWHRAHTTWFFETFVLQAHDVAPVDPAYARLFNSYYESLGPRHARPQRGVLSRPGAAEVGRYRQAVDARVTQLLAGLDPAALAALTPIVELGIAHEEQHQELILTDILHALAQNPLRPAYREPPAPEAPGEGPATAPEPGTASEPGTWCPHEGGLVTIGHDGTGFAFDNEGPAHRSWLEPYALCNHLVTVGQWKAFADDGGYRTPSLWLSAGLDWVRAEGIEAPLHARREGKALVCFTLEGEREACDDEPLLHVSFYEADAIARYLGARLPSEAEWEHAARALPREGQLLANDLAGPLRGCAVAPGCKGPQQFYGTAWEWTRSPYLPYPGYRAGAGALGEYNGKFMADQWVLRGGSFATPAGHIRASYRNFWPAATRFQFTGLRLARDL